MAKKLTSNVYIHGTDDEPGGWFGPDYPDNKPSEAQLASIDNPAAFEDDEDETEVPGPGQTVTDVNRQKAVDASARRSRKSESAEAPASGGGA